MRLAPAAVAAALLTSHLTAVEVTLLSENFDAYADGAWPAREVDDE